MPAVVAGAVAAAGTIAYAIVYVGVSLALSAAARQYARMKQKTPYVEPPIPPERTVTVRSTISPRQIIYGRVQSSGVLLGVYTHNLNKTTLSSIVAYAGHQCDGVEAFEVDGIKIKDAWADDGSFTPSGYFKKDGGPIPHGTGGDRDRLNLSNVFGASPLSIYVRPGSHTTQTAISDLYSSIPEWTQNHRGYKTCYVVYSATDQGLANLTSTSSPQRSLIDHSNWPNGIPQSFRATIRGRRLYDPRKDSTNGGSGSHRTNDARTWEWSDNWALCVLDYLTGGSTVYDYYTEVDNRLGFGVPFSKIDMASFIAAANQSDELVTVPAPALWGAFTWSPGVSVVGSGSDIYYQLSIGNYVISPTGTFHQVSAINGATQTITLSTAYTGSAVQSAVTQYNTSASSTTTQKRFTCNTQLSCTDSHADNRNTLLSAGNGSLVYVGGKYKIFSGSYETPVETIDENDVLGAVTISTHPQGEDLFNLVTGKFVDPDRSWTEQNYPSLTDASYQADDGGGQKQRTFDYYATSNVFACQRLANVRLQQSRNKRTISFSKLGPKATKISPGENFYCTLPEFGWSAKVFKCLSWGFMNDGFIKITAQEDSASTYSDLSVSLYQLPSPTIMQPSYSDAVPEPTVLTATTQQGGIEFSFAESRASNVNVQLWEHTASTPFSSAAKIWEGKANGYFLKKSDTVTRYYWVTHSIVGNVSANYPSGAGVAGNAAQALQANSLTTTAQPGAIKIDWSASSSQPDGTVWELFEHTANTPFSSATKIWEGTALSFTKFADTPSPLYYWVRARANNSAGPVYPSGNGVAGQGLAPVAPTGLTLEGFPTYIRATVTGSFTQGTLVRIHEHATNNPFSSSTVIAEGVNQNVFNIPRRDTTTRYYWASTKLSGQTSASYPSGNGSAGAAVLNGTVDIDANAISLSFTNDAAGPTNYYSNNGLFLTTGSVIGPYTVDAKIQVICHLNAFVASTAGWIKLQFDDGVSTGYGIQQKITNLTSQPFAPSYTFVLLAGRTGNVSLLAHGPDVFPSNPLTCEDGHLTAIAFLR